MSCPGYPVQSPPTQKFLTSTEGLGWRDSQSELCIVHLFPSGTGLADRVGATLQHWRVARSVACLLQSASEILRPEPAELRPIGHTAVRAKTACPDWTSTQRTMVLASH